MGWVAAAIAFAAVATAGSQIYSAEKAEDTTREAVKEQTAAMEREGERNRALQEESRKLAQPGVPRRWA